MSRTGSRGPGFNSPLWPSSKSSSCLNRNQFLHFRMVPQTYLGGPVPVVGPRASRREWLGAQATALRRQKEPARAPAPARDPPGAGTWLYTEMTSMKRGNRLRASGVSSVSQVLCFNESPRRWEDRDPSPSKKKPLFTHVGESLASVEPGVPPLHGAPRLTRGHASHKDWRARRLSRDTGDGEAQHAETLNAPGFAFAVPDPAGNR